MGDRSDLVSGIAIRTRESFMHKKWGNEKLAQESESLEYEDVPPLLGGSVVLGWVGKPYQEVVFLGAL